MRTDKKDSNDRESLMTVKEIAIDLIRQMPDESTLDEIMEELFVHRSIEERLRELKEGGIPHDEVKQRLARWLV